MMQTRPLGDISVFAGNYHKVVFVLVVSVGNMMMGIHITWRGSCGTMSDERR